MAKEAEEKKAVEAEVSEENTQLTELENQLADMKDKYMRTLAEYDNYRKRTIKEKESIYPEAKAVVVEKFIPLIDNFDRALESAENKDAFYEGVLMVKKLFDEVFETLGVEEIKAVGETFDPNLHNAVMHCDDENVGENTIVEEFQKGYKMGDRVLRYSMVKVAN